MNVGCLVSQLKGFSLSGRAYLDWTCFQARVRRCSGSACDSQTRGQKAAGELLQCKVEMRIERVVAGDWWWRPGTVAHPGAADQAYAPDLHQRSGGHDRPRGPEWGRDSQEPAYKIQQQQDIRESVWLCTQQIDNCYRPTRAPSSWLSIPTRSCLSTTRSRSNFTGRRR